jgi:hypothetical protein
MVMPAQVRIGVLEFQDLEMKEETNAWYFVSKEPLSSFVEIRGAPVVDPSVNIWIDQSVFGIENEVGVWTRLRSRKTLGHGPLQMCQKVTSSSEQNYLLGTYEDHKMLEDLRPHLGEWFCAVSSDRRGSTRDESS